MSGAARIVEFLRSGDLRRQLWAATVASGLGKEAVPTLGEFAKAITEFRRESHTSEEAQLFLGRSAVTVAVIASEAGDTCTPADWNVVMQIIEGLASDCRMQVLGHVVYAIEIIGSVSEGTATALERHVAAETLPEYLIDKVHVILNTYPRHR